MPIIATNQGTNYVPIPAGAYAARCFSMVHIGNIPVEYQGEIKQQNKVRISWELPTELKEFKEGEGEKPLVISKEYTLSMHEKSNLRKDLESWRGKGFTDDEAKSFDIVKLLGIECMLSIIHKPNTKGNGEYATISSISTVPKGMVVPAQINPTFEFNYETFTNEKFAALPDFLKDKIKTSVEFKAIAHPEVTDVKNDDFHTEEKSDDSLPF